MILQNCYIVVWHAALVVWHGAKAALGSFQLSTKRDFDKERVSKEFFATSRGRRMTYTSLSSYS